MKNILITLLGSVLLVNTGCLKDKGFDNNEYGTKDPASSASGVAFNLAGLSSIEHSASVFYNTTPVYVDASAVLLSLLNEAPLDHDVHLRIEPDLTILDQYNADNGSSVPAFDSRFTLESQDLVIPAGQKNTQLKISVLSDQLSYDTVYAMGYRIVSCDPDVTIASNMSTSLLLVSLRNDYEGLYKSLGYFYHPTAPRPLDREKYMYTISRFESAVELGDLGGSNYYALYIVDPITNDVTFSPYGGPTSLETWTSGLPTSGPAYSPQWANSAQCNNTYDPATHSFKVRYGYLGGSGHRVTEEILTLE